jgi:hypothetical protein
MVALACSPCALAQEATKGEPVPAPPAERTPVRAPVGPVTVLDELMVQRDFWQVDLGGSWMFGADGKQSGDFDLGYFEAGVAYNTSLNDDLRLRVGLSTQQSYYDFNEVTTIIPGTDDPWGHLQAYRLNGLMLGRINEHWAWFGGLEVRAAFESGADLGDSLEVRGTGGAEYTVSEDLNFTLGVAVGTQIEDDVLVIPLLGIEWDINEKTRLASQGLGLILSYEVMEHWSVGVFGAYELRDWRLDESRSVNADGVAREERVLLGLELRHRPSNKFEFAIEGGVVAWQKLESLDSGGDKVGTQEFDPAPFVGVSVIFRF